MPHEIGIHDTMVSGQGVVPWHKLGTVVQDLPYDDVLRLAGLDWEVGVQPVYALNPYGIHVPVEGYQAVVRHNFDDTPDRVISVVGSEYVPLQNAHGLEFLRILMDAGDIQVETAGSLRNNRVVWVCARMDRNITIGGDETVPYLIFSTSHDGTQAAGVTAGPVRVVCANTLRCSEIRANASWRTRHVGDIRTRVAEAREALSMGTRYYDAFEAEVNALMVQSVTDAKFEEIVKAVIPITDDISERARARRECRRDDIRVRWIGSEPTGWTALNAVNGYELWDRPVRGGDGTLDAEGKRAARQAMTVLRSKQYLTDRAHAILVAAR